MGPASRRCGPAGSSRSWPARPRPHGSPDRLAAACARAAGLVYAQHIILLHAGVDGDRLAPAAPGPGPAAPGGTPVHSDLLIFTKPGEEPAHDPPAPSPPVPAPPAARSCACRCGRPPSATPAPSGAAGTCPNRSRTRPRCCPRSPPPPSPATPSPGTWLPTRCAASAPPWSRPSTSAATASASSTRTAGPRVAAANIAHARRHGATGTAEVIRGDARQLPPCSRRARPGGPRWSSPPRRTGRASTGRSRPSSGAARSGGVRKYDNRYGHDPANLAHQGLDELLAGFTADPRRLRRAAAPRRAGRDHRPALARSTAS